MRPELELADELRTIAAELCRVDLRGDDLDEALVRARELRACIRGEERARWYDALPEPGAGYDDSSRDAYADLSPLRGELNPIAPPLRYDVVRGVNGERDEIVGHCTLSRAYEGLAGAAHGGIVAALFDDILGAAQRLIGSSGVTAVLRTRYREVTPLGEELCFRAWIHEHAGRRIIARATCHAGDLLTADCEGIFMKVDLAKLRERMEGLRRERA